MKIRDHFATINNDPTEFELDGIEIIGENGKALWSITLSPDGSIEVRSVGWVKCNGKNLSEYLLVKPRAGNSISIKREEL